MNYIHFDKEKMVNLSYVLNKELLRTNRAGAYGSTTLVGCNTRKYHGLLVAPQPYIDGDLHVLLSSLDESIIQHGEEFELAVHRYKDGYYYPHGHQFIHDMTFDPTPAIIYRIGGVLLKKERINTFNGVRFMVRYTLLEAHSDTVLKIRPLLAYRNRHTLSKANTDVETRYENISNGIKYRMYMGYSYLHFQFNSKYDYVHVPNWYYGFEYEKDKEQGFDYSEDLFNPGFFEVPMKVGQSVILSVGTEECNACMLKRLFNNEISRRTPRSSFRNCLINDAEQCVVKLDEKYRVIAGYQWLGVIPRDTFIALPGLTLTLKGGREIFTAVVDGMVEEMSGPFFNYYSNIHSATVYSADASLWFIWCLQKFYEGQPQCGKSIWRRWGKYIRTILKCYRDGTENGICADASGLLYQGRPGLALTWMNSIVRGKPVTPRTGYAVEINALWYNAIRFAIELSETTLDKSFSREWKPFADKLGMAFVEKFYDEDKPCLCDYFNEKEADWRIRPNQIIATGMKYSPLSMAAKLKVLEVVRGELLAARGIRTLSPRYPEYVAKLEGDHESRGLSMYNGPSYPWLLMFYVDTIISLGLDDKALVALKKIIADFEPELLEGCIGSISQTYNGNPPYEGSGTVSHAVNIAALLWLMKVVDEFNYYKEHKL